jgi:hypothetical protein
MRVSQVLFKDLKIGQRVKGLNGRDGTIIDIDLSDDNYVWVLWDGEKYSYGGWYGIQCEAELIDEQVYLERFEEARNALLKLRESGGFSYSFVD